VLFTTPLCILLLSFGHFAGGEDTAARIRSLIDARDLADAETVVVHELAADTRNTKWIVLLAEIRLDQHRFVESLQLLQSAIHLDGGSSQTRLLAGLDYVGLQRNDLAEPELRAATDLDPTNPQVLYYLGRLLYAKNWFDEAIDVTQRALAYDPTLVRAYDNLGLCYEAKQMFDQAQKQFLAGVAEQRRTGIKTEWPALDLGTMLIKQEQFAEAKPYIREALEINPDSAEAHFRFGCILERGDPRSAVAELKKAIQLDAHLASAHYRLAQLYRRLGKSSEAETELLSFQKLSGQSKEN
jgi:tetratricopeptide (TPR) repeat protein